MTSLYSTVKALIGKLFQSSLGELGLLWFDKRPMLAFSFYLGKAKTEFLLLGYFLWDCGLLLVPIDCCHLPSVQGFCSRRAERHGWAYLCIESIDQHYKLVEAITEWAKAVQRFVNMGTSANGFGKGESGRKEVNTSIKASSKKKSTSRAIVGARPHKHECVTTVFKEPLHRFLRRSSFSISSVWSLNSLQ